MNTQLKTLRLDSKGKSSEKMKQAVSELEYLTTFNRSVSQAMARTMQDLSEAVFINMANFTLARGHGGRVLTLSPPTSAAGVRSPSWP